MANTPTHVQVNFRMPIVLKDGLEEQARANGRTLTAEIVHRLETSLASPPTDEALRTILLQANDYLETISHFIAEEPEAAKRVLLKRRKSGGP